MKRNFHMVFKENTTDHMSKGENFTGEDPTVAISKFTYKYPHALFIIMYDTNALADIKGQQQTEVKQDDEELSNEHSDGMNDDYLGQFDGEDSLLDPGDELPF